MTMAPPDPGTSVDAPPPVRWRLEWRGHTFREEDLTGRHLSIIALLNARDEWSDLDVVGEFSPTLGPLRLMTMLSAFLILDSPRQEPTDVAAVLAVVSEAPADELLAALHLE